MKLNKFVCVCVTGQKNIFCIFLLLRSMSKKHGLGRGQKSQNIVSFRVQRSKKHFLWFSTFAPISVKNMVLVRIKSQKNIVSFRIQRSKKHFLWFFYFRANKFDQRFLGLRNRNLSVVFLKSFSLTFIASKGLFLKVRYVPERTRMKLYFCHTRIVLSEKLFHNNR